MIKIVRNETGPMGTFGLISLGNYMNLFSLELPWKDNHATESCILPGIYDYMYELHHTLNYVLRLFNVPGRAGILLHIGNWAGDTLLGYRSDSKGCILPGMQISSDILKQKQLFQSTAAMEVIMKNSYIKGQIEISWKDGVI